MTATYFARDTYLAHIDGRPAHVDPLAPNHLQPPTIPNAVRLCEYDGRPVSPQDLLIAERAGQVSKDKEQGKSGFRMSRAERRALLNPTCKQTQMAAVHVNDRAPNYRYRGLLKMKACHSCGAEVEKKNDEWSQQCPRCGWSEIEALDFSYFEHRQFIEFLRANPQKTTVQAYDWIQQQRSPEDRIALTDEEIEAHREALAEADAEDAEVDALLDAGLQQWQQGEPDNEDY